MSTPPVEIKPSAIDELDALRLLTGIRDRVVADVFKKLDEDLERLRPSIARAFASGANFTVLSNYVVREMWNPATPEYRGLPPLPEEAPSAAIAWDGPDTPAEQ